MLHFAFFFLKLSFASRNKIAFSSGFWRASEGSLLRTKNRVPLWTSQSFGDVASPNKIAFRSGLWRREFWWEIYHSYQQSLLKILESSPRHYHTMARDCFLTQFKWSHYGFGPTVRQGGEPKPRYGNFWSTQSLLGRKFGGQTGKDPLAPTRVFVFMSRDVGGPFDKGQVCNWTSALCAHCTFT